MSSDQNSDTHRLRADGVARLGRLADRMVVPRNAIHVRPIGGGSPGMSIEIDVAGGTLRKTCSSQAIPEENFMFLVLWLNDLVRNVERGIETFLEAFYNEGARELVLRDGMYDGLRANEYQGEVTREGSFKKIDRVLGRLGLTRDQVHLSWDGERNFAQLTLHLNSGRVVVKSSSRQRSLDHNIHVLALWLQAKAKNYERGLESDVETLFAANLLPA